MASPDDLFPSLHSLPTNLRGMFSPLRASRCEMLRHEIFGHIGHAEFVSPTIHHRVVGAKIIGGRRRRDTPLEGGGAPRVTFRDLFAAENAPQEIDEEEALRENSDENRNRNEI